MQPTFASHVFFYRTQSIFLTVGSESGPLLSRSLNLTLATPPIPHMCCQVPPHTLCPSCPHFSQFATTYMSFFSSTMFAHNRIHYPHHLSPLESGTDLTHRKPSSSTHICCLISNICIQCNSTDNFSSCVEQFFQHLEKKSKQNKRGGTCPLNLSCWHHSTIVLASPSKEKKTKNSTLKSLRRKGNVDTKTTKIMTHKQSTVCW